MALNHSLFSRVPAGLLSWGILINPFCRAFDNLLPFDGIFPAFSLPDTFKAMNQ